MSWLRRRYHPGPKPVVMDRGPEGMPSMVSTLQPSRMDVRPFRHSKTVSPAEACGMIRSGATLGVDWMSDSVALALESGFLSGQDPRDITVVYATADDAGRNHG
ncbi:MAG TPA: hypothetical protein VHO91_15195, partial [Rhodopila sp.]|nr:hypothetical protein [Rhodopila sp.]